MLERALNRIMLVVIASRFPETEKTITPEKPKNATILAVYTVFQVFSWH
ncbi:hypothetical protein KZ773_20340 [Escherichia coli]|nr:hypothetical protein [Escherichia coli]